METLTSVNDPKFLEGLEKCTACGSNFHSPKTDCLECKRRKLNNRTHQFNVSDRTGVYKSHKERGAGAPDRSRTRSF